MADKASTPLEAFVESIKGKQSEQVFYRYVDALAADIAFADALSQAQELFGGLLPPVPKKGSAETRRLEEKFVETVERDFPDARHQDFVELARHAAHAQVAVQHTGEKLREMSEKALEPLIAKGWADMRREIRGAPFDVHWMPMKGRMGPSSQLRSREELALDMLKLQEDADIRQKARGVLRREEAMQAYDAGLADKYRDADDSTFHLKIVVSPHMKLDDKTVRITEHEGKKRADLWDAHTESTQLLREAVDSRLKRLGSRYDADAVIMDTLLQGVRTGEYGDVLETGVPGALPAKPGVEGLRRIIR